MVSPADLSRASLRLAPWLRKRSLVDGKPTGRFPWPTGWFLGGPVTWFAAIGN